MEPGSVDLVFADPPFNIGYDYDVYDDSQSTESYLDWCRQWITGVHRALKSDGTFWLAIGDEFAAELKIESQKVGFHCRSWVIWYYTFGVNCVNGFSRSHTHLFHFVKNPKKFTFVRPNPHVRVKSARQQVYADLRANPNGRLPDNTWITRPQDAPEAFRANDDTWFYSRVAGTFKEREGFHGCQMPEQLLGRIIRSSSLPHELVLDPFGGSGTTLCVAKKLNRDFIGFELSEDYVQHINQRLDQTSPGDPLDGPLDPIESAPKTSKGKKRRKTEFDDATREKVIRAFESIEGRPSVVELFADKKLNKQFSKACSKAKLGGSAVVWNRLLLKLEAEGKLPAGSPPDLTEEELNQFGVAAEIAWRLVSDEFRIGDQELALEHILSCPDSADFFDQIATRYLDEEQQADSRLLRLAAFQISRYLNSESSEGIRKETRPSDFLNQGVTFPIDQLNSLFGPQFVSGIYVLSNQEQAVFVGQTPDFQQNPIRFLNNPNWENLELDTVSFYPFEGSWSDQFRLKLELVGQCHPRLNVASFSVGVPALA